MKGSRSRKTDVVIIYWVILEGIFEKVIFEYI